MRMPRLSRIICRVVATLSLLAASRPAIGEMDRTGIYSFGAFRFAEDAFVKRFRRDVCPSDAGQQLQRCVKIRVPGPTPRMLADFNAIALLRGRFTGPGPLEFLVANQAFIQDRPAGGFAVGTGAALLLLQEGPDRRLRVSAAFEAPPGTELINCELVRVANRDGVACAWAGRPGRVGSLVGLTLLYVVPKKGIQSVPLLNAPSLKDLPTNIGEPSDVSEAQCRSLPSFAASPIAIWQKLKHDKSTELIVYLNYSLLDKSEAECLAARQAVASQPPDDLQAIDKSDAFIIRQQNCVLERGQVPRGMELQDWCGLPSEEEIMEADGNAEMANQQFRARQLRSTGVAHLVIRISDEASIEYEFPEGVLRKHKAMLVP